MNEQKADGEQLRLPIWPEEQLTMQQIDSICLSYRHDFGLMLSFDRLRLRSEAVAWYEAFRKHGLTK